ncbi:hypothetical protein TPHA_0I02940 [Tetrapisispora phaffii CBS 4417]|uniref:Myotubularin phosphatase domain-containing protein n=1 Tax=Tetrapisispora phaffii (strain ATCC 24235 / CBS 4417 / NBRC 1672 / NRRL Y-8282 / UCD 70-5) TaxID=1071381 RepID=G8BY17_TETPH|nr:hypothetical protein TPHA_0I02940 [Tetrapisispora phaffii CBS 4417]CCE64795.1 hypothetical protein TPHA_0I02940 [Tetrapisispora phaffii CBS 4417]
MDYIKVTKVDDVILHRRGNSFKGTLHLTTHHLIFASESLSREFWVSYPIITSVFKNKGSALFSKEKVYKETNLVNNDIVTNELNNFTNLNTLNITTNENVNKWYEGRDLWSFTNIKIIGKDYTVFSIDFLFEEDAKNVYDTLLKLTVLDDISQLYAFIYKPNKTELQYNSWDIYDEVSEFSRQGLDLESESCPWRISSINCDYDFSKTYPDKIIVPRNVSDSTLKYASKYRSKERIPVLSYFYKKNKCSIIRAAQPLPGLTKQRSIQDETLVLSSFNCSHLNTSDQKNDPINAANKYTHSDRNIIVDARPVANAFGQTALGGGTENMDNYNYKNTCQRMFLGIDNIHVMSSTLNYVVENYMVDGDLNLPIDSQLLNSNKGSNWIKYVRLILSSTDTLLKSMVFNNSNLLIHCSDGWDRTTQVCSLIQLCLDPYFRTFEGFMVLVEKDWISFGHKFLERSGHLSSESIFHDNTVGYKDIFTMSPNNDSPFNDDDDDDEDILFEKEEGIFPSIDGLKNFSSSGILSLDLVTKFSGHFKKKKEKRSLKFTSPVFQQFLDCVYQLIIQNPNKFEFNERFIRRLVYHLYSCQYGSFLSNNQHDMKANDIFSKTRSVWDYFRCREAEFINKNYIRPESDLNGPKKVSSIDNTFTSDQHDNDLVFPDLTNIQWWWQLYGRKDNEMNTIHRNSEETQNINNHTTDNMMEKNNNISKYLPFGLEIFGKK